MRKWQPTPVFLPGESQGWGSLVGCRLWGCIELDTTEVTQQQQQDIFIQFFCIFLPLLNIFCFCQVHVFVCPLLSFTTVSVLYSAFLCMKCSLGISSFLEEISSLSHAIVFLYVFALSTQEGFLISLCYSLRLCIQMGIFFLFSFAFTYLLFSAICKGSQTTILPFLISFSRA